jgi:hypothetical protein
LAVAKADIIALRHPYSSLGVVVKRMWMTAPTQEMDILQNSKSRRGWMPAAFGF